MTSARRQLKLALDQQARAEAQAAMAIEDLQEARRAKKKKEEVAKAEKKLEKAEAKVEKAEEKVKEAKKEVNEAEEKVKAQQEKAIRCTASVWSQFSRKMQK